MLYEICTEINNFFDTKKYIGKFTIENGSLHGSIDLAEGQYFRIVGSTFNDGVYKYGDRNELVDEEFHGAIWAMAVPQAVIALAEDIKAWREKYEAVDSVNMSPYNSESFGGYSYSKNGGGGSSDGAGTWQKAFSNRLNAWRKICPY